MSEKDTNLIIVDESGTTAKVKVDYRVADYVGRLVKGYADLRAEYLKEKSSLKFLPKRIQHSKDLTPLEKLIAGTVLSLASDPERGCWATNEYIAKIHGCTAMKISHTVSTLKKYGFIEVRQSGPKRRIFRVGSKK